MKYVLALDQGTTSSRAIVFDSAGNAVATAQREHRQIYPQAGWVEHDADEIWENQSAVAVEALTAAKLTARDISSIGITNQRETTLVWDRRTGRPLGHAIVWQDRRTTAACATLRTAGREPLFTARTGLRLDPYFSGTKLAWLLAHYPEAHARAAQGELLFGTIDTWLIWKLTGGSVHATDASNASRTQLFDIHAQVWSEELCALFGAPIGALPRVEDSDALFGDTVAIGRLAAGVPIRAMIGDSHAALFGHGVRAPGIVKATYGTGSSLMTLTDAPMRSRSGLSTTIAWRRAGRVAYALEGNISVSAQAAAWTAELMGLADVEALTALAASSPDAGGVCFVPALAGLGAPHWKDRARAALTGMSLATTRAQIARAALEAIALQIGDVFAAMERDLEARLDALSVDGGGTRNDLLMQIQADLLGRPIKRVAIPELSAFGVGALAGLAGGLFDEASIAARLNDSIDAIHPRLDEAAQRAKAQLWGRSVRSVIANAALS